MKEFLLVCVFAITGNATFAQISKGTMLTGLDLNYSSSVQNYYNASGVKSPQDVSSSLFSISPAFGYFVSRRLAIGVQAGYGSSHTTDSYHGPGILVPKSTNKNVGPFVRYYWVLGQKAFFYLQGEVIWGKTSTTYSGVDPQTSATVLISDPIHTFQTAIRPGFVYFITRRIGLEGTIGSVGFTRTTAYNDDLNSGLKNSTNNFGVTLNSSTLNLGFRYYIVKKVVATL